MREKLVVGMLVTALFTAAFGIALKVTPVHAPPGGVLWTVPGNGTLFSVITTLAGNNDEIHIQAGWIEPPFPPYTIWQNNLWIIGAPPALGNPPLIDLRGSTITIIGTGVFIWGLNIVDTGPAAPIGILLAPPSGRCIIRSNKITGLAPGTIGIQVWSAGNDIDLNTMSTWGICIDLAGPASTGNLVVGNTFNPPYNWGIQVSAGAGFNQIYYNNLWVGAGFIAELWDANPGGSPPNAFDDTFFTLAGGPWGPSGGPNRGKGNFRASMPGPPIPPMTNGYMDMFPLAAPWAQIPGDINKDAAVDIFDIVWVAAGFGTAWCQFGWDPRGDLNGDGIVDVFDIVIVAANFGVIDP